LGRAPRATTNAGPRPVIDEPQLRDGAAALSYGRPLSETSERFGPRPLGLPPERQI